jgi:hypothetical protein
MLIFYTERDQGPLQTFMFFVHPIVFSTGDALVFSGVYLTTVLGGPLQAPLGVLVQEEVWFTFSASVEVGFEFGAFVILFTVFPEESVTFRTSETSITFSIECLTLQIH